MRKFEILYEKLLSNFILLYPLKMAFQASRRKFPDDSFFSFPALPTEVNWGVKVLDIHRPSPFLHFLKVQTSKMKRLAFLALFLAAAACGFAQMTKNANSGQVAQFIDINGQFLQPNGAGVPAHWMRNEWKGYLPACKLETRVGGGPDGGPALRERLAQRSSGVCILRRSS